MKQEKNWHHCNAAELAAIFGTDSVTGLTEAEARRRLRREKNKIWTVQGVPVKKYAARSLVDFATVLLVITALLAAVFGDVTETAAVCIMLLLGRIVRIGVYIGAQRVFEKNAAASLPRARVVREGTVKTVPADLVALGDVIVLDGGDTVPCDIRLTAADSVLVSESAVTDNEGIVAKDSQVIPMGQDTPVGVRTNMLYASSAVINGFCMGIAVATGSDTLVCAREGTIELSDGQELPVLDKLSDIGRWCSLGLVSAAMLLCLVGTFLGKSDLFSVFLPSVAMAAACLNEYVNAAGAAAWALALRPSKKESGAVFRSTASADRAADTQVLLLRSPAALKSGRIAFHSYYQNQELKLIGTKDAGVPKRLLYLAHCATGMAPGTTATQGALSEKNRQNGVMHYSVIRSLWEEHGKEAIKNPYSVIQHLSAGEVDADGMDSVLLGNSDGFYFACMGRVQQILSRCTTQRKDDEEVPLSSEERDRILSFAKELAKQGVTIAAVGFRSSHYNSLRRVSVLQSNLCFEGFLAVSERMEEGALASLTAFRREGGSVILFSDGREEDRCFCQAEGVLNNGDLYLTSQESCTARSIPLEPGNLSMICTPGGAEGIRQRIRLVRLCRESGRNCVYLGWGVEDLWVMREADVSFAAPTPGKHGGGIPQSLRTVAKGFTGSGGGGFHSAWRMIIHCRTAVWNIYNMLSYLIVSHVARLVLLLIAAAGGMPLLSASQLVFWGIVLDFSASLVIAAVPARAYAPPPPRKDETEREEAIPESAGSAALHHTPVQALLAALYGTLLATLAAFSPFLGCRVLELLGPVCTLSAEVLQSCMFLSCICTMPFMAAEMAGGGLFSKKPVYGRFFWIPFAVAGVGAVWAFGTGALAASSATQAPGWLLAVFALLPVLVAVAVMSLVRYLIHSKKSVHKPKIA